MGTADLPLIVEVSPVAQISREEALRSVMRQLDGWEVNEIDLDITVRIKDGVRTITVRRKTFIIAKTIALVHFPRR